MSAYTEQETQITDADILKECLKEKGVGDVQHHEKAVQLEGYHGDKRKDTAEIVIPRRAVGSMSNDIGFKKQTDGTFKAIISQYDSGKYNNTWMADLKKRYAEKKIHQVAKKNGLTFVGKKVANDGSFKMNFVKA
jgi:hypothetical protein